MFYQCDTPLIVTSYVLDFKFKTLSFNEHHHAVLVSLKYKITCSLKSLQYKILHKCLYLTKATAYISLSKPIPEYTGSAMDPYRYSKY